MLKYALWILLFAAGLLTGCAKVQVHKTDTTRLQALKSENIAVIAFYNYTQTPMAGLSAAAISLSLLQNHGYQATGIDLEPPANPATVENSHAGSDAVSRLKSRGYRYLLTGEVTEWRYKAGIDAEPVVGLVVKIVDLQNGKTIYSATGSKSSLTESSVTYIAQTLLDQLLP